MPQQHFYIVSHFSVLMASKKNDGGFQSQAGLVRYFDTENDKGIKLSPKMVIGIAIAFCIAILVIQTFVPMS